MEFSLLNSGVSCIYEKVGVVFNNTSMTIDGFVIDFPGEYEKSNILVEAEEFWDEYMFMCVIWGRKVTYVPASIESMTTDMITRIGDVDVLVVHGTKELKGAIEKIEPNVLVPYGTSRSLLLWAFGNVDEPVQKRVLKVGDYDAELMVCVSLADTDS